MSVPDSTAETVATAIVDEALRTWFDREYGASQAASVPLTAATFNTLRQALVAAVAKALDIQTPAAKLDVGPHRLTAT